MDIKNKKNSDIVSRLLLSILVSLAFSLTLFFFCPFELYANNVAEFAFGVWDFLGILLAIAVATAAVIMLILIWLPKKAYYITCAALALLSLMLYIQGTFLSMNMTALEGDGVGETAISLPTLIINSAVWIIVIGGGITAAVLLYKKHSEIIRTVLTIALVTVIGMQTISFITLALTSEGVWDSKTEGSNSEANIETLTYKDMDKVSSDKNVVYFLVDRFSSAFVDEANEDYPEIFDKLEGFTYYDDMVSLYPRTFPSVTYMVTGVENDFSMDRSDYFAYAWQNSDFLNILKDNNYNLNLYTEDYYAYEDATALGTLDIADNRSGKTTSTVSDRAGLIETFVRFSFYKALPFSMRDLAGSISSQDFNSTVEITKNDYNKFTPDMKAAYEFLKENPLTLQRGANNFSFIHIDGTHLPNKYDADFNKAEGNEQYSREAALRQSFTIINLYIEQMKKLGIYEDATIIITGDHSSIGSDSKDPYYAHLTALYIKPSGVSSGDIKVSSAPVAQEDIHATILASEGIENTLDYGRSIFDIAEDEIRERRYYFQTYKKDKKVYEIVKYKIVGPAKDFDNWEVVSREMLDKSIYK